MVSRTIYAFSLFIVLNLLLKVNVKAKVHKYFKKEDKHIKLLVLSIFKQLLIHSYILNFNLKISFLEIKGLNLMDIILVGFLHHFAVHFVEYMAFDLVAAHSLQDLSAHIADLATIEVDVAHDDVYFEMQSV